MVTAEIQTIQLDTYPEAAREALPMFAENRVHQRTSGNPYPNKVVSEAQRRVREKREYTLLRLENEYLEIGILPELGGKIWYARDKKKGYDFFYKNNVIKPALIGVLGSWTSGGLEFNWPFHHRASTFMPVDYAVEQGDGYAIVWLSEHEPINRMKGMVGVCLRDGECIFETRVKVDNPTPFRHSFLWWENAAVPVDESYEIFFPEDVNYVRFHYKRSVTTYPIANNNRFGAFNGIYYDGDTDISKHKNTRKATSYFSAESAYDYFGGYDQGKAAGVVHIADHHISPGKKMFTWAYSQLAKTWENALTDNDGQYAELMAGCYSDNQPDLTWLMPGETKTFSQRWFPIHDGGIPAFANENGAVYMNDKLGLQSVRHLKDAHVCVSENGKTVFEAYMDIPCYELISVCSIEKKTGVKVTVTERGRTILCYEVKAHAEREIPEPRRELPYYKAVKTAEELYLLGLHVEQYRSPEYSAEQCYLEALERDAEHAPSAAALAELYLKKGDAQNALTYIDIAERSTTRFNIRTESGKIYYLKGLALCALTRLDEGYDYLYKASWCYDYKCAAMLHIGLLDIRRRDFSRAVSHLSEVMSANSRSLVASAFLGYARYLDGDLEGAKTCWLNALSADKMNLYARAFISLTEGRLDGFTDFLRTDATQVVMDLAEPLAEAGLYGELRALIEGVNRHKPLGAIAQYVLADITGASVTGAPTGIAFPSRDYEEKVLLRATKNHPEDAEAYYLLGCLQYGKGKYEQGIAAFEGGLALGEDYRAYRNLAAAYYSHRNDKVKALDYMKKAAVLASSDDKQITFETAYLMAKLNVPASEIETFIKGRNTDRDDVTVELARAYNHQNQPDRALSLLLDRRFVACEGGEHYIADQYMYAYYLKGRAAYLAGDLEGALRFFVSAQELPQSLGSGLWNDIKKVPYQYFAARCLEKLGRKDQARAIYRSFGTYRFDYFTDMYLYTFAYYAAKGLEALGDKEAGDRLIKTRFAEFESAAAQQTLGYFGTTPFFISFIDQPAEARTLHYAYPLYLFASYLGDEQAKKTYADRISRDGYGMYIDDFTL